MNAAHGPVCKPKLPEGTVQYFISNTTVQEKAGEGFGWLLDRHPKSNLGEALTHAVHSLSEEARFHTGDPINQTRSVKALCLMFKEYPQSIEYITDVPELVMIIAVALRRHELDPDLTEAGGRACARIAEMYSEHLTGHVNIFVDALAHHPGHMGVQEAHCLALSSLFKAPPGDAEAPAPKAADRGAVRLLVEAIRRHMPVQADIVRCDTEQLEQHKVEAKQRCETATAAVVALSLLLEKHPRSCARAARLDAVTILHDLLAAYPERAELQAASCHALAQIYKKQPATAQKSSKMQVEVLLVQALNGHSLNAEVQMKASDATAWLVGGFHNAAEEVALAGVAEAMLEGAQRHVRTRTVQEAVSHALAQLFGDNNAMFAEKVRNKALALLVELLRREAPSATIQAYAALALANLCAHHAGSARDAAMAGACELLLATHRMHSQNTLVQGNALLAIARIVESHPASSSRAVMAGATPRFAEALDPLVTTGMEIDIKPSYLLDDEGTAHVAAALTQFHIIALDSDPSALAPLASLRHVMERFPPSAGGAARAGGAETLPFVIFTCLKSAKEAEAAAREAADASAAAAEEAEKRREEAAQEENLDATGSKAGSEAAQSRQASKQDAEDTSGYPADSVAVFQAAEDNSQMTEESLRKQAGEHLAIACCALGLVLKAVPSCAQKAHDQNAVRLLVSTMRRYPEDREAQLQASHTLCLLMMGCHASAQKVFEAGGHVLLQEAMSVYPDDRDMKVTVNVAFRILGYYVPELTPFPFVEEKPGSTQEAEGTEEQPQ